MLDKKVHIQELYELKHQYDSTAHNGYDYENNLLSNLLSNLMFGNNKLKQFLPQVQKIFVLMIDSTLPIRNFWNYTVDKYYDKHNN